MSETTDPIQAAVEHLNDAATMLWRFADYFGTDNKDGQRDADLEMFRAKAREFTDAACKLAAVKESK